MREPAASLLARSTQATLFVSVVVVSAMPEPPVDRAGAPRRPPCGGGRVEGSRSAHPTPADGRIPAAAGYARRAGPPPAERGRYQRGPGTSGRRRRRVPEPRSAHRRDELADALDPARHDVIGAEPAAGPGRGREPWRRPRGDQVAGPELQ